MSWEPALLAGQDPSALGPEEGFGYGVDSGSGAFMGPEAVAALEDETSTRRTATRPSRRCTRTTARSSTRPRSSSIRPAGPTSSTFPSGFGDGFYWTYVGRDADGQPVVFVTDFWVLDAASTARSRTSAYTPPMTARAAFVLLVVFGTGAFLAGLELMITAVALPSILADLVAPNGSTAWLELRKASWIVNGYLLVYIVVMPLAGRLADAWGARRLFLGALACSSSGQRWRAPPRTSDQLIAARLVQAVGGGVLVPVGTAAAAHLYDGPARARALGRSGP